MVGPAQREIKEGIVKWISKSDKNNSFCLTENDKIWYKHQEENIEDLIAAGDEVKVGFELEGTTRVIYSIEIVKKGVKQAETGQGNKKEGWEDEIIAFKDLLNRAHEDGLWGISAQVIPELTNMKEEYATFKASVTMRVKIADYKGGIKHDEFTFKTYEAHGDATQKNCQSTMIKPHFLRMAETRAVARALRWATNNAKVTDVETGDVNDVD